MNILEHFIKEIHCVTDVSMQFEKVTGQKPKEKLLEVDLTVDCYGSVDRRKRLFSQTDWEVAKLKGFFMA